MAIRSALAAFLSLTAAGILFAGCDEPERDPNAAPSGALGQCIGTPEYDVQNFRALLDSVNKLPGRCVPDPAAKSAAEEGPDSADFHMVVLNRKCELVADLDGGMRADRVGSKGIRVAWDGRNGRGAPMPSGEYYINTELSWVGAGKDTTYARIGHIKVCPALR